MVEESNVVVGLFQRPDLAFDEGVEGVERLLDIGRYLEIHGSVAESGYVPSENNSAKFVA